MDNLPEDERRRIAQAAQEAVNAGVLRQLAKLVRQWREEEVLKRRVALAVLALLAVSAALAAWFLAGR